MSDINYNRTPEEEKELQKRISKRVAALEKGNYASKKLKGPEMQKRIKKIIEEEVNRK